MIYSSYKTCPPKIFETGCKTKFHHLQEMMVQKYIDFIFKSLLKIYVNEGYKFPKATNFQTFFKIVIFNLKFKIVNTAHNCGTNFCTIWTVLQEYLKISQVNCKIATVKLRYYHYYYIILSQNFMKRQR